MVKIVIKKASKKNFDDLTFLIGRFAKFIKCKPPTKEAKKRLKKDASSKKPKYEAYIAYTKGKPIGYASFYMTYSTFAAKPTTYIGDLFVLEEHRKKGVGKKLFKFCVKEAKKRHCGKLELRVPNWLKNTMVFYEKLKLKKINRTPYELTKDKF